MADNKARRRPRRTPGRASKPWVQVHHADGPRVDKKAQRAFEAMLPYCVDSAGASKWGAGLRWCFKTRAQAERVKKKRYANHMLNYKRNVASCAADEAVLMLSKRAIDQLNIPKTRGSLRDAALDLKKQLDREFAKHKKSVAVCKDHNERYGKPTAEVVRRYKRGSKTKAAMRNPLEAVWYKPQISRKKTAPVARKSPSKKGAHHGR